MLLMRQLPAAVQRHHIEVADVDAIRFSQSALCFALVDQITDVFRDELTLTNTNDICGVFTEPLKISVTGPFWIVM